MFLIKNKAHIPIIISSTTIPSKQSVIINEIIDWKEFNKYKNRHIIEITHITNSVTTNDNSADAKNTKVSTTKKKSITKTDNTNEESSSDADIVKDENNDIKAKGEINNASD